MLSGIELIENSALSSEEFATLMEALSPFKNQSPIAVAVSGGMDSLCLAFLLQEWASKKGRQLQAVIIDHKLRFESTAQAKTTADLLQKHQIPSAILSWEGSKPTTGIQKKARAARYQLLISWCHRQEISDLFLAHHADDQLETALMREKMGSHPRGLAGMSACVMQGGVHLWRPLLPFSKSRLQATLLEKKIPWLEDPSNQDLRFMRTQVRRQCLSFSESERQQHLLKIQNYGFLRKNEEVQVKSLLAQAAEFFPQGYVFIKISFFEQAPLPLQRLAFKKLLQWVRGKEKFLKTRQIDFFLEKLSKTPLKQGQTLNGCFLKNTDGRLLICREFGTQVAEMVLDNDHPLTFLWDDRFLITLKAAPIKPLTLKSLGEKGLFLIKKRGVFERYQQIPRLVLPALPALWEEDVLLEIPHLNLDFYPKNAAFQEDGKIDRAISKVLFVGELAVDFLFVP